MRSDEHGVDPTAASHSARVSRRGEPPGGPGGFVGSVSSPPRLVDAGAEAAGSARPGPLAAPSVDPFAVMPAAGPSPRAAGARVTAAPPRPGRPHGPGSAPAPDPDATPATGSSLDPGPVPASSDAGPTAADWAAAEAAIHGLTTDAEVLLVCHVNPDGDALGSMLGFGLGLRRLGLRRVQASYPGPGPVAEPFRSLPGLDLLVPEAAAPTAPELLVCFDAASAARLGGLADRLDRARVALVLDHHASNTRFGGIHLVDPLAAATSVVVAELLSRLDVPLDAAIAECLYVALATDTGSFRFDMTTPAVHELAARLIATGLKPAEISRRLFDTRPFGAVKLYGDVLTRAELEPAAAGGRGLVWTYATLDDLARHRQQPQVLEPLIDSVRCAAEADVCCVVKQTAPREWAVSMRSKGGVDVSAVAVALGGGGHRLAAGFTGRGTAHDVIAAIRAELDPA